MARKEQQEKDLLAWIAADPKRQKEFGDVLPALNAVQAEEMKTRERDVTLGALSQGSMLLSSASTIYRMSLERPKKDLDRDPQFQERNWKRIQEGSDRMQRTFDPRADRAFFRYAAMEAAKLPADQRIAPFDKAAGLAPGMSESDAGKAIDAYLDKLYAGTKLADKEVRAALLSKSTAEVLATRDSFVELAVALYPLTESIREADKARTGKLSRLRPRYMQALLAKAGGLVAPDANSTLRVTYGKVVGVSPRDGLTYVPQTKLAGVVEKHTGEGEFDAPKKLLDAAAALRKGKATPYLDPKLGDVPVDFLSTVDTTGGNSGSATLDAKGDLCGLLFDGTYETVASDILYDPVRTRSIHVDSRYLLWVLSDVEGATEMLQEMGFGK
ncbi:MAG: hypothetical protein EDX89_24175 [Acidobacteria bacterium]|nr:MAG: hypothetical protein EDX89_24175 [Acidobacteriota bacterium]